MRRVTVSTALMLVLAGTVFHGCGQSQTGTSSRSAYKIEEQPLGRYHRPIPTLAVSKDAWHFAYVTSKGKKLVVVVDGRPGPEHEGLGMDFVVFSPDGKRVAYAVSGIPKMFLVVDGKEGPKYDWIFRGQTLPSMGLPLDISSPGPIFDADGVLEYLAVKKGTLYRVKHVPVVSSR